jgi:CubicO group peptidase (beta-lactamase class C family)
MRCELEVGAGGDRAGRPTEWSRRSWLASAAAGLGGTVGWTSAWANASKADFTRAADYSAARGGAGVLVWQDGRTVFERYDNGWTPDRAVHVQSATKSFWGICLLAMIEDGLVASLDELAAVTLTEWAGDPQRSRITLRMLLDLSSGLKEDIPALQGNMRRTTWARDKYAHAVTLPSATPPGSVFRYGPSHYYALGETMKRKLSRRRQSPLDYLKARVLDPIGCRYADWVLDDAGNPHIPNGCFITPREWLKYGQFMLGRGLNVGRAPLTAAQLRPAIAPSAVNPGMGLSWWLNKPNGMGSSPAMRAPPGRPGGFINYDGPLDMYAALGAGRNGLYVVPSRRTIVIRQCSLEDLPAADQERMRGPDRAFRDDAFLELLFAAL